MSTIEINDVDLKSVIEDITSQRFNRENKMLSPFVKEKTPSFSIYFDSNKNKWKFKDFSSNKNGDAIDFVMMIKGLDYTKAREYLGIPLEKSIQELQIDKVRGYIEWEIKILDHRKDMELLGLFNFVDKDNNPMYYKAKFKASDGKKSLSYYHVDSSGKIKNKRNGEELLYNLYNVINGIKEGKTIIVTEGEKDSNSLNATLRNKNYVATSCKNIKDFSILMYANIFVCGDTGLAGDMYIQNIKKQLFASSKVFKIISLPSIKNLGDNKDVTDWLESGHTKNNLLQAFRRSLDLKSKFELQQDFGGIYRYKSKGDEDEELIKTYISNFTLIEATRIDFIDKGFEGVKIVLKSCTGAKIERIDLVTVFDDIRVFKNFLGSLDLAFTGTIADLTALKTWINNYFAIDSEEVHVGVKLFKKNDTRMFITNDGAMTTNKIDKTIKSQDGTEVNIVKVEEINAEEMKEVMKNLFTFATVEKTMSIIGSVTNNFAAEQIQSLKLKNHHLLIVGESGSGKSTILENVIAPILNYPKTDIKSVGLITPFALIKNLSDGNYPLLFDEYKPSLFDRYKNAKLSETFRNLYDRTTVSRGDKSLKSKNFQLSRPLILVGEESYPNAEKALMERSCIVYLSKKERTERHIASMEWLTENEDILNKLGKSLINIALDLDIKDYKKIRGSIEMDIKGLKNRPLNTCINICSGIEIFNILLEKLNVRQITNYIKCITRNIEEEVLEDKEEAMSQVETMLVKYNSMIEDGRAHNVKDVIRQKGDGLFIKSSEMLNQISEYVKSVNSSWVPLDLKDFRKQAKKAGYLMGFGNKSICVGPQKTIRFDTCDIKRFRNLDVNSIVKQEVEDVTGSDNVVPFK